MIGTLLLGGPERKKLDALQAKRRALLDEVKAIEKAGVTEAEFAAAQRAQLENIRYRHPMLDLGLGRGDPHIDSAQSVLALLLAVVGDDALVGAMVENARALGRRFGTVPTAERKARIGELRAQIRQAEIEEERETCALEDKGFAVVRRGDIDGALVLSVWRERYSDAADPGLPAPAAVVGLPQDKPAPAAPLIRMPSV